MWTRVLPRDATFLASSAHYLSALWNGAPTVDKRGEQGNINIRQHPLRAAIMHLVFWARAGHQTCRERLSRTLFEAALSHVAAAVVRSLGVVRPRSSKKFQHAKRGSPPMVVERFWWSQADNSRQKRSDEAKMGAPRGVHEWGNVGVMVLCVVRLAL